MLRPEAMKAIYEYLYSVHSSDALRSMAGPGTGPEDSAGTQALPGCVESRLFRVSNIG